MTRKKSRTLRITDDIDRLLERLPPAVRRSLEARQEELVDLIEVVTDLGRRPEARFPGRFEILTEDPVTRDDLRYMVDRIGAFGKDNRAGIEATLHRISAIRNRAGDVVGLTARVGRAVYGTIDILRDVIESGRSILLLGRPGVGKTTMLREVARVLADDLTRRVVIVDTSNEIAGDGDIPHPGIGMARRMQVPQPDQQHAVMIEAVENHSPEVVVVDEIGTEAEAYAARTIAERGVMLVATAHGNTLENLLMNPTLSDLVGGIQVVTLSDEEARRRKTQKAVLERKAPPTFEVIVEIRDKSTLVLHEDVAGTIDQMLRGQTPEPEIRTRNEDGEVEVRPAVPAPRVAPVHRDPGEESAHALAGPPPGHEILEGPRIFPYAVSRNRLSRAIGILGVPARIVRNWDEGDLVLTIRGQERRRSAVFDRMRQRNMPIFALRANTTAQMQAFLEEYFHLPQADQKEFAAREAEEAIRVVQGSGQAVDLSPQVLQLRRLQHELAQGAHLGSRSLGIEPQRHVRIYKQAPGAPTEDGLSDEPS